MIFKTILKIILFKIDLRLTSISAIFNKSLTISGLFLSIATYNGVL